METGLNASHLTCPHFELFAGTSRQSDGDDTVRSGLHHVFASATAKRRSYADWGNRPPLA